MKLNPEQGEKNVLAHWTYSREEWNSFLRWKKKQKGLLPYIFHFLWPVKSLRTPEVMVTHYNVITGDGEEVFNGLHHELRRVNIMDAGPLNIIEITYERKGEDSRFFEDIKIPVPKGKLREAIRLQQNLTGLI